MPKHWVIVVSLLTVAVALLHTPPLAIHFKATALAINVLIPKGSWRPLQWATWKPTTQDTELMSESGRILEMRIYRPQDAVGRAPRRSSAGVIIYTPFIGGGVGDERLVNLAETFARAGFTVATPVPRIKDRAISDRDIADILAATKLLLKEVPAVGLFGISYGNGPVFATAARLGNQVPFIVSLNGMYDLQHLVDFIETGNFSYQNISGHVDPHPYTKEVLDTTRRSSNSPDQLRQTLSPATYVSTITSEVFIIHSTADQFIPYTESLRLYDALQQRTPTHLVLTDVIEHGTYRALSWENTRRSYLPAATGFYLTARRLLTFTRP